MFYKMKSKTIPVLLSLLAVVIGFFLGFAVLLYQPERVHRAAKTMGYDAVSKLTQGLVLPETVKRQLVLLASEDWKGVYMNTHPSTMKLLGPVFAEYRNKNGSSASDVEIFAKLNKEYTSEGYTDQDLPFEVIGFFMEDEDLCHAVIRRVGRKDPLHASWVETLSFAQYEGDWRALLTPYLIANVATEFPRQVEQAASSNGG
jgi:hypothetical protein